MTGKPWFLFFFFIQLRKSTFKGWEEVSGINHKYQTDFNIFQIPNRFQWPGLQACLGEKTWGVPWVSCWRNFTVSSGSTWKSSAEIILLGEAGKSPFSGFVGFSQPFWWAWNKADAQIQCFLFLPSAWGCFPASWSFLPLWDSCDGSVGWLRLFSWDKFAGVPKFSF